MKLKRWNLQDHLETPDDVAAYLSACLAEHDADLVVYALDGLVRLRGIEIVASAAGLAPEELSRSLLKRGGCDLSSFLRILHALGLELRAANLPPR